jgi:DNA replication initiation complex subunit (GINS family)
MSDTLYLLRDTLLAQRDSSELVQLPAGIMDQAERYLADLKTKWQATGDELTMNEHEAIISALESLQEERAERIWAMAYTQASPVNAMTQRERTMFEALVSMAAQLRGVA